MWCMHMSLLPCKFTPYFDKALVFLFPATNNFAKWGVEYFCRNFAINLATLDGSVIGFAPAIPSLVNYVFPFLLVFNKGLNLLDFGRYLEKPHLLAYPPPEFCHGGLPRCLHYLGCSIALALLLNSRIYSVLHPLLILLNQLLGIFLVPYL